MPAFYSHIQTAKDILGLYEGKEPFHHFIKGYFKEYKKFGSRDRKQISQLCYKYFRLGKSLPGHSFEERMVAALFLASREPSPYLELLQPEWYLEQQRNPGIPDKLRFVSSNDPSFNPDDIFPFNNPLSNGIDHGKFFLSHLDQPYLFLRARPGRLKHALALVKDHPGFLYAEGNCLAFENNTNIQELLDINRDVVIQDRSSQEIESFFPGFENEITPEVWDACAASGGKSILAADHYNRINLTVSDKRESILFNLQQRLQAAGIPIKHEFITDLSVPGGWKDSSLYDLVIADVPCTGSGTWGRTPENLVYFDRHKIEDYKILQESILSNLLEAVKPGGGLLYITCSVFRQENEEVVSSVIPAQKFEPVRQGVIAGYERRSDTMFASLWRRHT